MVAYRKIFFDMLNKNPELGMWVAGTLIERLPDDLEPGLSAFAEFPFEKPL